MIFPEPLPFCHDYGCVGLRDMIYLRGACYADDIVLCGTRSGVVEKKPEDCRRAMPWNADVTGREFGMNEYI